MNIAKRVGALEGKACGGGFECHRVIQRAGQTRDEALNAYGRDRIGPDDVAVLRVIVFKLATEGLSR